MRGLKVAAVILGAVLLVPGGAHVLELPHKLAMDRDAYFIAQRLYMGWALSAIPIFAAIAVDLLLWRSLRRDRAAGSALALASAALIVAGLAVFFIWVFPANQATQNWTVIPDNWATLRTHWEYGHSVVAALTAAAFVSVVLCCVS